MTKEDSSPLRWGRSNASERPVAVSQMSTGADTQVCPYDESSHPTGFHKRIWVYVKGNRSVAPKGAAHIMKHLAPGLRQGLKIYRPLWGSVRNGSFSHQAQAWGHPTQRTDASEGASPPSYLCTKRSKLQASG